MMRSRVVVSWTLLLAVLLLPRVGAAQTPPAKADAKLAAQDVLQLIDKSMALTSDYKGTVRMREVRKDGTERAMEMLVYRRDKTKDLLFVVTQPRNMAGGGYLRIDQNLWEYSPLVGQWQRNTRRGNILNTITCENDFDRSRFHDDYLGKDDGVETLDGTSYRKLLLNVRPGLSVTFPQLRLWLDPDNNVVKRVGYSPSGKPLRTDLVRSYQRLKDPATGTPILHYKEVLEVDEEEGTKVVVHYDDVDLSPLSPNIFTKAWLEGRTR